MYNPFQVKLNTFFSYKVEQDLSERMGQVLIFSQNFLLLSSNPKEKLFSNLPFRRMEMKGIPGLVFAVILLCIEKGVEGLLNLLMGKCALAHFSSKHEGKMLFTNKIKKMSSVQFLRQSNVKIRKSPRFDHYLG